MQAGQAAFGQRVQMYRRHIPDTTTEDETCLTFYRTKKVGNAQVQQVLQVLRVLQVLAPGGSTANL